MIEETPWLYSDGLRLEGRLLYAEQTPTFAPRVLLCPPHPFLGGDLNNNVVRHLLAHLARQGCLAFSFNYRGIGASETDEDLAAAQEAFWKHSRCPAYEAKIHRDCRAALAWLLQAAPENAPCFVIGYSFGCLPALSLGEEEPRVVKLALISPPLNRWAIDGATLRRRLPRGVYFAPGDFACPEAMLEAFFQSLPQPKSLAVFPGANHFFIGREAELAEAVSAFLLDGGCVSEH